MHRAVKEQEGEHPGLISSIGTARALLQSGGYLKGGNKVKDSHTLLISVQPTLGACGLGIGRAFP